MQTNSRMEMAKKWGGGLATAGAVFAVMVLLVEAPLDSACVTSSGAGIAYLAFAFAEYDDAD